MDCCNTIIVISYYIYWSIFYYWLQIESTTCTFKHLKDKYVYTNKCKHTYTRTKNKNTKV